MSAQPLTRPRKCSACGLVSPPEADTCRRCGAIFGAGVGAPTFLGMRAEYANLAPLPEEQPARPCPQCRADLALVTEYPRKGSGAIVLVLGLILAPVIIGIFIMMAGYGMMNDKKQHWHCRGCGRTFPV